MANPLTMKLEYGAALTDSDRAKLAEITVSPFKAGPRENLISAGDSPKICHLVLNGFAYRYKVLADGSRSIVAFLLPGDICNLHVAMFGAMDHSIVTASPCTLVQMPRETIVDLTENFPRITRALWWATLVDESILREWLVNLGCRASDKRLAHLMCELFWRLRLVGLVTSNSTFRLPLTQQEVGETLGITGVHVSRVVQQLREKGLMSLTNRQVHIPNIGKLETFADFDPTYLHLSRDSASRKMLASI